jgi:EXLDI family protein
VPNKTIYVSESDLPVFQRAQELEGGNLSAAIAGALRRYVDVEEGRQEGFEEFIVRVGPGRGRRVRFTGVLLGEWGSTSTNRVDTWRVYRGRTGKFVIHTERSPEWTTADASGKAAKGWRANLLGIGVTGWGASTGDATLEVVETVDELKERIPPPLFAMVAEAASRPPVEDLDI